MFVIVNNDNNQIIKPEQNSLLDSLVTRSVDVEF